MSFFGWRFLIKPYFKKMSPSWQSGLIMKILKELSLTIWAGRHRGIFH